MEKEQVERLAKNIRRLRNSKGWPRQFLAAKAGITLKYLAALEKGLMVPSKEILERLANAFGEDLAKLLGETKPQTDVEFAASGKKRGKAGPVSQSLTSSPLGCPGCGGQWATYVKPCPNCGRRDSID